MQVIDVHSELKKWGVTLLVMSKFFNLLGASRTCVDFCVPTDLYRLKGTTAKNRL